MSEENMYRRGDIWWLRTTADGREYRESLRTGDVKSARKRRDKRISEINDAAHFGEVTHTWEESVKEWIEHSANQLARSTLKRYAVSLKQCCPFLKGRDISKIDGKIIQHLVTQRRNVDKAMSATVRRDLTAISQVLEYAEALEWREGNPTLNKRKLLKERRDPIVLPAHQDIELVCASTTRRFSGLIRGALLTGCRQDELCSVTWKQFSNEAGTLEVRGKGNKRRTIQLSGEATRHIDGTPVTLGTDLIFCSDPPPKADDKRKTKTPHKWSSPASNFGRIVRSLEKRARIAREGKPKLPASEIEKLKNFKRFRFHDLRHLFAVEALRGGMGLYKLQKHLGHTSVLTTEIYLDFLTPEEAEAAKAKAA